ncbi:Rv3235 family protein [Actinomyces timonensis]|uniref:Rv3235 family protein n=1 Tax=Actinomyces timonensis TaxID=1288391 RepID=UPI0002D3676A|nr:Rv3235 family protein [Actinomyces timonensis]
MSALLEAPAPSLELRQTHALASPLVPARPARRVVIGAARVPAPAPAQSRASASAFPRSARADRADPPQGADAARAARVLITAAVEVLLGLRAPSQLDRWTEPDLMDALLRRAGLALRHSGAARRPGPIVRSVHTQPTANGECEATVLLDCGGRVRAAAARLVPRREKWVLASLEVI